MGISGGGTLPSGVSTPIGGVMRLLGYGKPARYLTQEAFKRTVKTQVALDVETLAQLGQHGISDQSNRRVEFFFYTNSLGKGESLAVSLRALGYSADSGESPSGKGRYFVSGWTTPMRMDEDTIVRWTEEMCRIGFEHDCEFDGWGTYVEGEGGDAHRPAS
jgi:regulator of RNase E activity RraB